ncbi:MAG: hypothetical protein Q9184_002144 [Pyrenodesmia sp. 2 TL-2023]
MDSPFTTSSSSSLADSQRMPPPHYSPDQTLHLGISDFPLPIRSSSPPSGANERNSPSPAAPELEQPSSFPSLSYPVSSTPRKRRRETYTPTLSAETVAKSRRTTPSPALTGNTTPGSSDSLDFSQYPDLLQQMLGEDSNSHWAERRAEQEVKEREYQARKELERMDAEFARQLAQTFNCEPPDQLTGPPQRYSQSFLDSNGQLPRSDISTSPALPDQPLPKPEFNFSVPQDDDAASPYRVPKKENLHPPLPYNPDNFIDLGSEDEDEPMPPNDIVSNPRNSQSMNAYNQQLGANMALGVRNETPAAVPSSNTFGVALGANDSFAHALAAPNVYSQPYGSGWHTPQAADWANTISGFGQSLAGMASGAWLSAANLLDQHIASYPTNGYVGYAQFGSSTNTGPQVIDLEAYDEAQPSTTGDWYRDQARRNFSGQDLDRYLDRVNYLTNDPTRTAAEIKDLLENIRPDEDLPEENREDTPEAMVYPLMPHQKLGLAWMKSMEEGSNKGGILADDMGLGKTIQALALMVTRRSSDPSRKTTLIIAPVALMKQWEQEIKTKIKGGREHRLTTFTLHGPGRGASWEQLRAHDVVLTTYGTLSTEMRRRDGINEAKRKNPNWRPITKADRLPLLGDECKWYRVILDEAQCIKNKNTKAAQGACALQASIRFCMSGTPMQNGVGELFSLVHFLRIKPYSDINRFNLDFTRALKSTWGEEKTRGMRKLQALLKAILLRRNKKSIIDGQPILTLPERTTESRHAAFSEDEQLFYNALENRVQLQFNKYLRAGTVGRNYSNVLVLLLRLRQACCHPHLIKDIGVSAGGSQLSPEDLLKMAKELAPDVVARVIEDDNLCPICMDATENAIIFIPCGHSTCSECFAKISDPSQAIANGDDGGNDIKCPNCRGKISTSKVTDRDSFNKVHIPDPSAEEELADELQGPSDSESDTDDDCSDGEGSDLGGFIVDDDEETTDEEGYRKGKTPFERCSKQPKNKKCKKAKGKGKAEDKPPKKTLAQLKKESLRNMKARKKYVARLRKTWETSAKIDKTIEILQGIQDGKEGEKTIIFSQFTSLLDLLEIPIYDKGWTYTRYDGSMSAKARNEAVEEFQEKPKCKIMLVSLRAGNSGLNLVAASQVIMLDPFWNPYVEEQAIDRAHRIGQQRPVQVHRVLVPGTVEDRILALQEKKRAMIESALDENASREVGRLGVRELGYLFVSIALVIS